LVRTCGPGRVEEAGGRDGEDAVVHLEAEAAEADGGKLEAVSLNIFTVVTYYCIGRPWLVIPFLQHSDVIYNSFCFKDPFYQGILKGEVSL
jgi:hypothetical protein